MDFSRNADEVVLTSTPAPAEGAGRAVVPGYDEGPMAAHVRPFLLLQI